MEYKLYSGGRNCSSPDVYKRVEQNRTDSTRDRMRQRYSFGGRMKENKEKGAHQSQNGCNYDQVDAGRDPGSAGQSYEQTYKGGRCPLKAYPLSCSEYGSPCLDKDCEEGSSCCRSRQVIISVDHASPSCTQSVEYSRNEKGIDRNSSESATCCRSCPESCSCEGNTKTTNQRTNKGSKACCGSCSEGGLCEGDRQNSKLNKKSRKTCCSSCSEGGPCEGNRKNNKKPKKACCGSCSKGGSCEDEKGNKRSIPSKYQSNFSRFCVAPFRQCGVISNYMGFIPGLQMAFGEPYGITANRLLERHFSEQESRNR